MSLAPMHFNPANLSTTDSSQTQEAQSAPDEKTTDPYFDSYSHFYIHEEMLRDTTRTNSYCQAIEGNPEAFKDKIVLDIGCGTGILSIFAARAGAKHVYAIDAAEIASYAKEIVRKNGFANRITVIRGKVEDINLTAEVSKLSKTTNEKEVEEIKADIIISEWMGYCLLYESMFETVCVARDKWLKPGGLMLPDKYTMYIAGINDT